MFKYEDFKVNFAEKFIHGVKYKMIEKDLQYPLPCLKVGLDTGRVENFACVVSTEESPCQAIKGKVDVALADED